MKFAQRTHWPREFNALTRLKTERLASGRPVLDLTDSNPISCGLSFSYEDLIRGLDEGIARYDPHPFGDPQTREAVARMFYPDRSLDRDHITLTAGTSEAYHHLFRLVCENGDNVLMPQPGYPLFSYLAGLNDVEPRYYHLHYDHDWRPDFDQLRRLIDERTRMVIVIQPHNPLGRGFLVEDWQALADLALRHGLLVVSDEVFLDYALEEQRLVSALEGLPEEVACCVLEGLSKSLALPQMKVSWMVWRGPKPWLNEALSRMEVLLDTYLSVSTLPQRGLITWGRCKTSVQEMILDRIKNNLLFLNKTLPLDIMEVIVPYGGWAVTLRLKDSCDDERVALELLRSKGVLVHPGYFFDFDDGAYLVLSTITPPTVWAAGVSQIAAG